MTLPTWALPFGRDAWMLGLLLLLALPAFPGEVRAQERLERQSEILPARGILEITPELRTRFGLFPEFPGFRVARLFLGDPGPAILELEGVRAGRVVRERRELSVADLDALRRSLEEQWAAEGTRAVLTREGRGRLVLGQTLLGLGYHGWAVPVALDLDSPQSVVAAYLLTAGASFYVPYRLTRDRTVSPAHHALTLHGGSRGILTGVLVADAIQGRDPSGDRVRTNVGGGVLAGVAGSFAGFLAADRWGPASGTAALWGAMGDAGLAAGAALAVVAGPYADEEYEVRDHDLVRIETRIRNRPLGHLLTVAGQGAGFAAGGWMGSRVEYTTGNVSALRSSTILGTQTGVTLTRAVGVEEGRGIAAGGLVGGLAGIVGGDRLLRPVALSGSEGLLVNAGHLAGAALALGTTYLLVEDFEDREVLYLSTSTVGSLLGAGLVWRAVASDSPRFDARGPGGTGTVRTARPPGSHGVAGQTGLASRISVQLDPGALVFGALEGAQAARRWREARAADLSAPDPRDHAPDPRRIPPLITVRF